MSGRDERELIARIVLGDEEAFEELVCAFHGPLSAFFYRTTLDREDARNLLQETFLKIYRHSASYDPSRPVGPWIFAIAANVLRTFVSKRANRRETPSALLDSTAVENGPDPEKAAVSAETRRRVVRALMELSVKHRTVFVLKHFHGMRYEEIAAVMDTTVGTVKSRMHYACRELRKRLGDRAGGSGVNRKDTAGECGRSRSSCGGGETRKAHVADRET